MDCTSSGAKNSLSGPVVPPSRIFYKGLDSDSDDKFFTKLLVREEELSLDSDSPSNEPNDCSPSGDHAADTMAKLGMFVKFESQLAQQQ